MQTRTTKGQREYVKRVALDDVRGIKQEWGPAYGLGALAEFLIDLLADFEELLKERQWQPIETAPKDGTLIILGNAKAQTCYKGCWLTEAMAEDVEDWYDGPIEGWYQYDEDKHGYDVYYVKHSEEPTHWHSWPAPPAQEGGKG